MKRIFDDREKKKTDRESSKKKMKLPEEWEEQYIRRAKRKEQDFFADEDSDYEAADPGETEQGYQDLVDSLKAAGVYRGEDTPAREPDRNSTGRIPKGYRARVHIGKVAGIALVCGACVFAASMTSEANRTYLINNFRIWSGADTKTVVGNDEANENADTEEDMAFAEIEEKLGIEMPRFYYRPYKLNFMDCVINTSAANVQIEYDYQGTIIAFYIDREDKNTASNINSAHGDQEESIITVSDNIQVTIEKIQDIQDETPSYSAQWQRGNVLYYLSGKIELEELKKMMQEMKF